MGISYSFADNIAYGTEDINDITRSLVGAGVAPFVSKGSYSVSDLNVLTEALVGSGVQLDGCKCRIETADGKNIITVGEGIVFFENGVRLTVDSDGYQLETNVNEMGYVFAEFNTAMQSADVVFASQLPDNGIVVCLAEVTEKNEIKDVREIARSKVGTLGKNVAFQTTLVPEYFDAKTAQPYQPGKYALERIDVDISRFNCVYIEWVGQNSAGIFDLNKNRFLVSACGIAATYGYFDTNVIFQYNTSHLGFEIVDDVLTLYGHTAESSGAAYIANFYNNGVGKYPISLLFM